MCTRTDRLVLRSLEEDDLDSTLTYHRLLREKPFWLEPNGETAETLNRESDEPPTGDTEKQIYLAVLLKRENKMIGVCRIRITDASRLEAEALFDFDSRYSGESYAIEAALEIVRLGFEELRLRRISSWCISSDVAIARMLEGSGMRAEDMLPRSRWMLGEWWDTVVYSIHRDEWAALSKG